MRSIWKGTVSFGLVSIGVKLFSATEERDVSFHQVRRDDGSRIRYKRVAEADGTEVAYADIARGYQLPDGGVVVLSDDDFADLPLPTAKVVDVLEFVPASQIDPIYFAKAYYLEPEKSALKPYVLLRDALSSSDMAGLVKVAIRNREQLATLRVRDGVIVLQTMIWPDEVREPDFGFLSEPVELRPQERAMAESLVASMASDFDPTRYTDDYREALQQVIDAKVEGRQVVASAEAQPTAGTVVDLMGALRASVAAAKRARGQSPDVAATEAQVPATARASRTDQPSARGPAARRPTSAKVAAKVAGKQAAARVASKPAATKQSAAKVGAKPAAAKVAAKPTAAKVGAKPAAAKVVARPEAATPAGKEATAKRTQARKAAARKSA